MAIDIDDDDGVECSLCCDTHEVDCDECDGSGVDDDGNNCEQCEGSGTLECPECG